MVNTKKIKRELGKGEDYPNAVKRFEAAFAKKIGSKKAILFGSGNHALETGLDTIEINKNEETIVQAFTCKQVPKIISTKSKTRLIDIDNTYNLDIKKTKLGINPKTKILYAIYSYGKAIPSTEIEEICKEKEITLIEDCAHSIGARNGRLTGTIGEFSIFSLRKNLPAGNGGVLCTSNKELYSKIIAFRGEPTQENKLSEKILEEGLVFMKENFRKISFPYILLSKLGYGESEINRKLIDCFHIALAKSSIDLLDEINKNTIQNAKLLMKELGEEKFYFNKDSKKEVNVYTRVPVYFKKPKEKTEIIWAKLQEEGFETGLYYKSDFYKTAGSQAKLFPESIKAAEHMVPVGVQGLNKQQIFELAQRLKDFSK